MQCPRVFLVSNVPAALVGAAQALPHVRQMQTRAGQRPQRLACDVETFLHVRDVCVRIEEQAPSAVILLLRDVAPEECIKACAQIRGALGIEGAPLAVIFPTTDPEVWQRIYASGAAMFLPWHGCVLDGLPTYVGSLLSLWTGHGSAPSSPPRIRLDAERRSASIHTWRAEFTPIQFRILAHLVERKGRVVTKEELADVLRRSGEKADAPSKRSLYQHISQIRKKLGPHAGIVKCLRQRGYVLDDSLAA